MVVSGEGLENQTREKERESAVLRWMTLNPLAAARLILMLMPEGDWTETDSWENWN
jgi:hypothetical protein